MLRNTTALQVPHTVGQAFRHLECKHRLGWRLLASNDNLVDLYLTPRAEKGFLLELITVKRRQFRLVTDVLPWYPCSGRCPKT